MRDVILLRNSRVTSIKVLQENLTVKSRYLNLAIKNEGTSTATTDDLLAEQGRRIRALHEIISRPDLTFDQQIDATLTLGCRLLGLEIGKVGRLNPAKNESEFLNTVVTSDFPIRRGMVLPLDKTYCNVTFSSEQTLAISDVENSEYKNHPAASFSPIRAYIGCSINVRGKKFGTVNFSNRTPIARQFSEADKDLVNLMGSWISVMMERKLDAEELQNAKDAAEQANIAKSVFLAHMSHEIRTPLTAIIGFADYALNDDQTKEQLRSTVEIIRKSGDHLLHLINDVLDLSKIEAGKLDIEFLPVNIASLIDEISAIVSGQTTRKGLQFAVDYEFPLPRAIPCDPLRLKQILLNLCSNAIKFTSAGLVRIYVAYDRDKRQLQISVSDSGIGMTAEQVENLFTPFKQADASISRKYGGTGLGLSLSKRIAVLLNGTINVVSEWQKGSTFTVLIQFDEKTAQQFEMYDSASALDQDKKRLEQSDQMPRLHGNVLLADDNELNQILVQKMLEKMGASVTVVSNGEQAVEIASVHKFDLIYLDMQMPVMSGIDALINLRELGYDRPIAMLTANATVEDRDVCARAGSNDYVTKPITFKRLYAVTSQYLKRSTNTPA